MRGFECGEKCVGGSANDFERGMEVAGGVRHCCGGGGPESGKRRGFGVGECEGKMSEVAERGGERGGEAEGGLGHSYLVGKRGNVWLAFQ